MSKINLHPDMLHCLLRKTGLCDPDDVFRHIHGILEQFIDEPEFLGTGAESFVYRDGSFVKKFILNWSNTSRTSTNLETTCYYLTDMSKNIRSAKHIYSISVKKLNHEVLLITYPYEASIPLKLNYLRKNWHKSLKSQYIECQYELMQTGYFFSNLSYKNFRLVKGVLKFIDYGRDCLPLEDAFPRIGRMVFMLLNDIYDLGP